MTTRIRGRGALSVPKGTKVRPTSDRVREAIFNILGQRCDGDRVLDLYAGTGALGIEALVRGAAQAVLVEKDADVVRVIRRNLDRLVPEADASLEHRDAGEALRQLAARRKQFDLIFADPPYDSGEVMKVLEGLNEHPVLGEGGVVIIEHSPHERAPERLDGIMRVDQRRYGQTQVSFYKEATMEKDTP